MPFARAPARAPRSAACACRSPAATTSRTRSPRSRWRTSVDVPFARGGRGARQLPRRRAPLRDQGRGRRRSAWWTTTATIRPSCAPRSPPRAASTPGRIVVVFQPHRYTRTRDLFDAFTDRLPRRRPAGADRDLRRRRGEAARRRGGACWPRRSARAGTATCASCPTSSAWCPSCSPELQSGDLVLTLGAGSVSRLGPKLLAGARGDAAVIAPELRSGARGGAARRDPLRRAGEQAHLAPRRRRRRRARHAARPQRASPALLALCAQRDAAPARDRPRLQHASCATRASTAC